MDINFPKVNGLENTPSSYKNKDKKDSEKTKDKKKNKITKNKEKSSNEGNDFAAEDMKDNPYAKHKILDDLI